MFINDIAAEAIGVIGIVALCVVGMLVFGAIAFASFEWRKRLADRGAEHPVAITVVGVAAAVVAISITMVGLLWITGRDF